MRAAEYRLAPRTPVFHFGLCSLGPESIILVHHLSCMAYSMGMAHCISESALKLLSG